MAKIRSYKRQDESVGIDVREGKEAQAHIEERLQEAGGPPVQDVKHTLPPLSEVSRRRSVWPGILSFCIVIGLAIGAWFTVTWWMSRTISVAAFLPEDTSLALFLPESDATRTALAAWPDLSSFAFDVAQPYGFSQDDLALLAQHELVIGQRGSGQTHTMMMAVRRSAQLDDLFEQRMTPINIEQERSVSALVASADGVPREILSQNGDVLYVMRHRRAWVVSTDIEAVRDMVAAARGEQTSLSDDALLRTASDVLDVRIVPTLYSGSVVSRTQWQPLWDTLFGSSSLVVQSMFVSQPQFVAGFSQSVAASSSEANDQSLGWDVDMVFPAQAQEQEMSIASLLAYVAADAEVVTTVTDVSDASQITLAPGAIRVASSDDQPWIGWTPAEWAQRARGPVVVSQQDGALVVIASLDPASQASVLDAFESDLLYAYATAFPSVAPLELADGTTGEQYLPNETAFQWEDQTIDASMLRVVTAVDAAIGGGVGDRSQEFLRRNADEAVDEGVNEAANEVDGAQVRTGMGYAVIGTTVIVSLSPQAIRSAMARATQPSEASFVEEARFLSGGASPIAAFSGCIVVDDHSPMMMRIIESVRGSVVMRHIRVDQTCSGS